MIMIRESQWIYKLQTYLNGKPNFGYQLDTYSMKCDI
jgi:hypothetical protein